jgi:hypothetical protein
MGRQNMPIDPNQVQWDTIDPNQVQWDSEKPSELGAIPAGINSLLPAVAGLPSDTLRNLINLGISGYGMARQGIGRAMGETPSEAASHAPSLLPPMPLGSQDIQNKINQALSSVSGAPTDVFSNPRPESPLARGLYTGSQILGAGLLSPAAGAKEALGNVARMAPSAIGATTAQAAFPNQPLAPALGALAPAGFRALIPSPKPIVRPEAVQAAKEQGFTVPPTQLKPSVTNRLLEGWAGKISTGQGAAIKNIKKINEGVVKDLGLPKGTVLSKADLENLRANAGDAYKQASNLGSIKTDSAFKNDLARISGKNTALTVEFPGLLDKGVNKIVNMFNRNEISAPAAVEASKQLRADASKNFRAPDAKLNNLARAQKSIADSLDKLIERTTAKVNPGAERDLVNARKLIAKTYTAEKALNEATGNISAKAFARDLAKGKPLSGEMKKAGQFAQAFPTAAQEIKSSMPGLSPLDVSTAAISASASGNPSLLGLVLGRPAMRSLILSKPYQKLMTRQPKPIDQRALWGAIIQGTK